MTSTTKSCSGPPILSSIDVRMWNIRFSKLVRVVYKTFFLSIGVKTLFNMVNSSGPYPGFFKGGSTLYCEAPRPMRGPLPEERPYPSPFVFWPLWFSDRVGPGELPKIVCIIKLVFSRVLAPLRVIYSFGKNGWYK